MPKAGRKWEPQGLPRSEARVQATLHPWRKAHTAISSASTLTIATALDEFEQCAPPLDCALARCRIEAEGAVRPQVRRACYQGECDNQ